MSVEIDEYLETKVMTSTPYQLHLMVIDAALKHALAAEASLQERRIDKAHASLSNARKFVIELITGLDPNRMVETVDRLKALFLFIHRRLIDAERQRDPRPVADAVAILRQHRQTWLDLGDELRRTSAAPAAAENPAAEDRSWAT